MDTVQFRLIEEINSYKGKQKELAEGVGVSQAFISQIVHGKKMPDLYTFKRLCQVLDVSADYLLGLED